MTPPRGGKKVRRWVLGEGYPWFSGMSRASNILGDFHTHVNLREDCYGLGQVVMRTTQLPRKTKKYRLLLEEVE